MSQASVTFHEALESGRLVAAPGAHNVVTARLIQQIGYPAIVIPGSALANTYGYPDAGLVSLTEVLVKVKPIIDSVQVPVIVDADTGFGGVANVQRTVRDFEHAGAAALLIEDQVFPKRCGYVEGALLVSIQEMQERILAAIDGREDPSLTIVARIDGKFAHDFDEVLERANSYKEAGADMIFVNGMTTIDQVRQVGASVPGPHIYNFSGSDMAPKLTAKEVEELGYSVMIFGIHALRLSLQAIKTMLVDVMETGDMTPWLDKMITFDEWQDLTDVPALYELETRYEIEGQSAPNE